MPCTKTTSEHSNKERMQATTIDSLLASCDNHIDGMANLFRIDDDEEEDDCDCEEKQHFNPDDADNETHTISISNNNNPNHPIIIIPIVQTSSAFRETGEDETGGVLWGAAIHLANYVVSSSLVMDDVVWKGSSLSKVRIIELGCGGCALASIAFAKKITGIVNTNDSSTTTDTSAASAADDSCSDGRIEIVATDFMKATLSQAQYNVEHNKVQQIVKVQSLDWNNAPHFDFESNNNSVSSSSSSVMIEPNTFDVVMASDVIYGMHMVPLLIQTIDSLLTTNGIVIIATRDHRRGVKEFCEAIKSVGFREVDVVAHDANNKDQKVEQEESTVPSCFQDPVHRSRWNASHTVYAYKREKKQP